MKLVAGVDGGNTKTVAVACDEEGGRLGIGRGGCGNWEVIGEKNAAATITEVMEEAISGAGGRRGDVVHAQMGLAGQDWPEDEPRMRGALVEAGWHCDMTLENDGFLTVRGGAPEGYGIGVTAGTGICAAIVRPDGEKYFYGAFTDLGGGRDIDGEALTAVIRAEDGRGPATALTEGVLRATGHESVRSLVHAIHREGRSPGYGALRRALFAAARQGDGVAVDIVTRFGAELALCGTNLMRRYGLEEEDPAVVASGSLFMRTGPLLFEAFRSEVLAAAPRARVILTDYPPVMGALRGALGVAGWETPQVWQGINREVSGRGWFRASTDAGAEGGSGE